jgi:uncharacterized protein YceH (UPF0502 family)
VRKFVDKHLTIIIVVIIGGLVNAGISIQRNIVYTDNLDREVNSRVFELEKKVGELERRFELLNDKIK